MPVNRWVEFPEKYWILFKNSKRGVTLLLIALFIVGLSTLFVSPESIVFLSTLALAQSSVLAIVFSVTILGIQLTSRRYSPRMISIITGDQQFRETFWFIVFSVAYDLVVVLIISDLPPIVGGLLLVVAFLLASASTFVLWQYIGNTLDRSTPEGLLNAYQNKLNPVAFWDEYQSGIGQRDSRHPLHDLYEMAMSALSNNEWLTASRAIDSMRIITVNSIQGLSDNGTLGVRIGDNQENNLFHEPLENHLPRLINHATELDEDEIGRSAINLQAQIGHQGLDNRCNWLAREATNGLRTTIRKSPDGIDGHPVRTTAFSNMGELLLHAIEHPDPIIADWIVMAFRNDLRQAFYRNYEQWAYHTIVDNSYRQYFPEAFSSLLGYYDKFYSDLEIDWRQDHPSRDIESIQTISILFALRRALIEVTGEVLDFERRNESFPGTKSTMIRGWKDVCEHALESEATEVSIALIQDYIELSYIEGNTNDPTSYRWAGPLAELFAHGNQSVIGESFRRLSEQEGPEHTFHLFREQMRQPEPSIFERVVNEVLGETIEFDDWLNEFYSDVQERADQM